MCPHILRAFRLNFQRLYFPFPVSQFFARVDRRVEYRRGFHQTTKRVATADTERASVSRKTIAARYPVLRATIGPVFTCKGSCLLRWQPSSVSAALCFFPLSDYSIARGRQNVNIFLRKSYSIYLCLTFDH